MTWGILRENGRKEMLLVISQRAELEDTMLESARVRCLFEGEGSQQKLEQLGLQLSKTSRECVP